MGVISDSINLFSNHPNDDKEMIALPIGEVMRWCPITLADGEKADGHMESYNRKTKLLKISYTTKDGKTNLMELNIYDTSEGKARAEHEGEQEIAVFSVSGKLVYLMRPS